LTFKDDRICVFLGCDRAIALRPCDSGEFLVVGRIKVAGLDATEAFLGPMAKPWKIQAKLVGTKLVRQFWNPSTGEATMEDPRLNVLPPEWEELPAEERHNRPTDAICFKNKVTGHELNSDPRLLPEALVRRGVELRTFHLI
jgi:hypothetical protein